MPGQSRYRLSGERLYCVFVNNGLLRKDEHTKVIERFKKHMKLNLIYVNASKLFLGKLKGVENPEKKRRIIGREFINVFMKEAKRIGSNTNLMQSTLNKSPRHTSGINL